MKKINKYMKYETCKRCGTAWTVPECPTPERHNLRERREQMGLTLRGMATILKISAAFLSDVELGRRNPNEKILKFLFQR